MRSMLKLLCLVVSVRIFSVSSRSSSVYERLLKCMLSFLITKSILLLLSHFVYLYIDVYVDGPLSLIESGKSYMNYLESLRSEFKVSEY